MTTPITMRGNHNKHAGTDIWWFSKQRRETQWKQDYTQISQDDMNNDYERESRCAHRKFRRMKDAAWRLPAANDLPSLGRARKILRSVATRLGDFTSQDFGIFLRGSAWMRCLRKSPQYILGILPGNRLQSPQISTILRNSLQSFCNKLRRKMSSKSWLAKWPIYIYIYIYIIICVYDCPQNWP